MSSEVRMNPKRIVLQCALSLAIAVPAYLLLLLLAVALPLDSRISNHLEWSIHEGLLTQAYVPSNYGQVGHQFDMFSECVGLSTNLGNTDDSLLYRAIVTPYIASDLSQSPGSASSRPCSDLIDGLLTGQKPRMPYFRFWQGSPIYMRILLAFVGFGKLRILNAVLLYGSMLFLALKLQRWMGPLAVPVFLLPYALMSDLLSAPLVTVHALPLAWTYISAAWAMILLEKHRGISPSLFLFAFISGSFYNFVSMLFSPQLVPAWLAFVAIAAFVRWDGRKSQSASALWHAAWVAVSWFSGFATTWMAKWALAVVLLGFTSVRNSVSLAASGTNYRAYSLPGAGRLF